MISLNDVYQYATKKIGDWAVIGKDSQFYEKGMLTPDEFVQAGDKMVQSCGTWQWCTAEGKKLDQRLPQDKQYLITVKVPSHKRISQLEAAASKIEEVDLGNGWVEAGANMTEELGEEMDMSAQVVQNPNEEVKEEELNMDEAMDLDDLMNEGANTMAAAAGGNIFEQTAAELDENPDLRKYDITITYDFYHRTPRMWLNGYAHDGRLLNQQETIEDIMGDYANKTVTFEEHHMLPAKWLSIHPCNHANAMKRIIDTIIENGGKPRVESSMFFFLKFISAVTPTIEYDFTIDLELD